MAATDYHETTPISTKAFDEQQASLLQPAVFTVVPLAIGFAIAEAVYHFSGKIDSKFATLGDLDLQWLYFSAVAIGLLCRFINVLPATLKNAAMQGRAKGNIRANMYLFTDERGGLVVLDEQGAAGRYNRANRSIHHFTENAMPFLLCMPLAGFCFGPATFVLTLIFCLGRVLHQVGYSSRGYGGHALGFIISTLAAAGMEGLVLLAGLRAAGVAL